MLSERRYAVVPENQSFTSGGDTRPVYSTVCGEEGLKRISVAQNQSFDSGGDTRPVYGMAGCTDGQNLNSWLVSAVPQNQSFTSGGDTRPVYAFSCCPPSQISPYPIYPQYYYGECFVQAPPYCGPANFLMPCELCLTLGGGTCTCIEGSYTLSIFNGLSGGPEGAEPYWKSAILNICGASVYFAFFLAVSQCAWQLEINCNGTSTFQQPVHGDPSIPVFTFNGGVAFTCGTCGGTVATGGEISQPCQYITWCDLSYSPSAPVSGDTVTATCTVSDSSGIGSIPIPQGTVEFFIDGSSIGTQTLSGGQVTQTWTATCTPHSYFQLQASYTPSGAEWYQCACQNTIIVYNCISCCAPGTSLPNTLHATISNVTGCSCLVGTYEIDNVGSNTWQNTVALTLCGTVALLSFSCNPTLNQFIFSIACNNNSFTQAASTVNCATPHIVFTGLVVQAPGALCGFCNGTVNVTIGL